MPVNASELGQMHNAMSTILLNMEQFTSFLLTQIHAPPPLLVHFPLCHLPLGNQ